MAKENDINQKAADLAAGFTGMAAPTGVYDDLLKRLAAKREEEAKKNPAAVELGRLGGLKGGKARAKALTPKERSAIAARAACKRWEILNLVKNGVSNREIERKLGVKLDLAKMRQLRVKLNGSVKTEEVVNVGR